jgi:aspartyl/glutamyl-tRNA(Asn/Gln) amidotransferase C subunit
MSDIITADLVKKMAELAQIPVSAEQAKNIHTAFDDTLEVIENLKQLDTKAIEPTHQVTGLSNVVRDDVVIPQHSFTQEEALSNAAHTHEGYFVVGRILEND